MAGRAVEQLVEEREDWPELEYVRGVRLPYAPQGKGGDSAGTRDVGAVIGRHERRRTYTQSCTDTETQNAKRKTQNAKRKRLLLLRETRVPVAYLDLHEAVLALLQHDLVLHRRRVPQQVVHIPLVRLGEHPGIDRRHDRR